MDELEKKRRQLADPNNHLNEVDSDEFDKISPQKLAEIKANQLFEQQLQQAMNVDVPEELADKVFLKHRIHNRRNFFISFAMAASIALVSILSFQYFDRPELPITEEALAHVYDEADYMERKEVISSDLVLERLADMGLSLPSLPDKITFASGCRFGKDRAMHLIAEVAGRQVTLFVTDKPLDDMKLFGDENLMGQIRNVSSHGLIAVAEDKKLIDLLFEQVSKT